MQSKPNIIVILADDLGYSDLGCFGGEIDTPNLDRLATRGTRMSSFYVTPRCSPSRAALLTGQHPHAVGVGILTSDDRPNGYRGALATDAPTLAQLVRAEGYATALAGKWHLSSDTDLPNETWPTRRGFDEFYGILPGCGSYFQPRLYRGEDRVSDSATHDYYLTDDISDYAIDFAQRSVRSACPFFLYLAYTAPHWPLHARTDDIAKYRERYAAGWDVLRTLRHARQRDLGMPTSDALPERDEQVVAWEAVDHREWEIERMATYAAQVTAMDRGIGRLIDALAEEGVLDDTLIVFSSDNGACAEPLSAGDAATFLVEDICPRTTRDGRVVRIGNDPDVMPGPEDTYASYGRGWAHLSNTPFRLYKRWVHEGGIASALVASWPRGDVSQGTVDRQPAHLVDIFPTILDAIGAAPGETAGVSILEQWRNPGSAVADAERPFFWEHIGNAAVRRGRWKLVRESGRHWELYDIENDRGETTDLASEQRELCAELEGEWSRWAERTGVIPWSDVVADYRARGILAAVEG